MLECFSADLPASLAWADDLLTRYGRWAAQLGRGGRTCGSAEGDYRAPVRGDDDARRTPAVGLTAAEAVACNRSFQSVPDRERIVLRVLYVPQRQTVEAQLRLLRIPASLCRIRHESGVRMFANVHRLTAAKPVDKNHVRAAYNTRHP